MVDATGTTSWTYDNAAQVTQLATPQGTLTYAYDDAGRRTSMADTTGTTSYAYDDANRLTSLTNPHSEVTGWTYDNANRVTRQDYHSTAYVTYAYDHRDRVTDIYHRKSNGTTIVRETYDWGDSGNLDSKTIGSDTVYYTYDDIDQLLSEVRGTYSASYTYDANGNRLTKSLFGNTDNYTYDDADKLTSITRGGTTQKSFGYDAAGRTTSITTSAGTTSYAYDYAGRVSGITFPSTATNNFSYNGLDTRVGKTDSAGSSTYRRDGVYVTAPLLSNGAITFTPNVSARVAGTTRYQHRDWIGSSVRQTDSTQATSSSRRTDSYGNLLASSGSHVTSFGFAAAWGYQEDPDSGLSLLGHRYYDPSTGRFLTRDNAKDGKNWYSYASASPTRFADPSGYYAITLLIGLRNAPLWPPGEDPDANIQYIISKRDFIINNPPVPLFPGDAPAGYGNETLFGQWLSLVRPGGDWDYKKDYPDNLEKYDDAGNFNYGATAAALGFKLQTLINVGDIISGVMYGQFPDQEDDRYWTQRGYEYFHQHYD